MSLISVSDFIPLQQSISNMHAEAPQRTVSEKLYLTDDGLRFDDSILWLDSKKSGNLSFLSSAHSVRERYSSQVIVSQETQELLKLYNPDIKSLVCQYNRPFSIGRYNLELLQAGSVLGGSSLYIETNAEKFLYAPMLSRSNSLLAKFFHSKKVDYLILKVDHCENNRHLLLRKKEEEDRFLQAIETCLEEGRIPVVVTPLLHTASALCFLLSSSGVKILAHKHVYDVNKVYESFGQKVGEFKQLNLRKIEERAALVVPPSFRLKQLLQIEKKHQFFFINDRLNSSYDYGSHDIFHIPLPQASLDIVKTIKEFKPKKTFLFGPYAKKFSSIHKSLGLDLEVLNPFQQNALL